MLHSQTRYRSLSLDRQIQSDRQIIYVYTIANTGTNFLAGYIDKYKIDID